MFLLALQTFLACVAAWTLWQRFKPLALKSPLENLPGPASTSAIAGNMMQILDPQGWSFHEDMLEKYGKIVSLNGLLGEKLLYVTDPTALYSILLKDSASFEETEIFTNINRLAFGIGLMGTIGDHHKKQRKMLNPVFSIAHLRRMTPIFYQVIHRLSNAMVEQVANGREELDVLEWMGRAALELIGQAGLGYSFDPLESSTDNPYTKAVKSFFPTLSTFMLPILLLPTAMKIGTPKIWRWIVERMPWKRGQALRHIVDVMAETSEKIFEEKKLALKAGDNILLHSIGEGKDIMSILMKENMNLKESERMSDTELLGQMSSIIFAAMDTTSSALARILWLLSHHQDVQDKLRDEISEARMRSGDLDYDELNALPFLDAVCRETLRLHAPVPWLSRTTLKDTLLSVSEPVHYNDGTVAHSIPVPKGTEIMVGILGTNRDKSIWGEDACEWKPERWLKPLPDSVINAKIPGVYSNLMTFISGGRSCIGFKFSELEMKVVLSLLIDTLIFEPTAKDILWNMGQGVQTPSIKGTNDLKPVMPLKVTLAQSAETF